MSLHKLNNVDITIQTKILEHYTILTGEKSFPLNSKVYIYGSPNKSKGYIVFTINNKICKIEWIYAPKYGKILMKKIVRIMKKRKIKKIILYCSIDPTEDTNIVMKRLNFYIGLQYRVKNIIYRSKYGPLLYLEKEL